MYFTSNWPTVKDAFLKKYSLPYVRNMKRELQIDFEEEATLRSFVDRKLTNLATYTTLSLTNQMEVVINDLPSEISYLFIQNEKVTRSKAEILEFCDSIQDLVQTFRLVPVDNTTIQEPLNRMEVFNFDSELESELESMSSCRPSGSGAKVRRGRSSKPDVSESSGSESNPTGSSSKSSTTFSEAESMSINDSPQAAKRVKISVSGGTANRGKIVKRGRGRPRKNMLVIPEEPEGNQDVNI